MLSFTAMRHFVKRFRGIVVGWIIVAVIMPGVTGIVLCVGADGHVALEAAHEQLCHQNDNHEHGPHGVAEMAVDSGPACCTACVDIGFPTDVLTQPMRKGSQTLSGSHLLARIMTCAAPNDSLADGYGFTVRERLRRSLSHASAGLLARRTVVLRI